MSSLSRRSLFQGATIGWMLSRLKAADPKFRISLAEWSFHKAIQSRLMTNLDFPRIAREQFGIEGLEFVNQLWEAPTQDYVARLKGAMHTSATKGVLIMCDGEGRMGASDKAERMRVAANHYKWVDIAAELGCHSIRVNMYPSQEPVTPAEVTEFVKYCAESFGTLCQYAQGRKINVIIENHGGISSQPGPVVELMKLAAMPNLGTLPDFGNFPKEVDRYDAVTKMMPYAKGVSFKCVDFGPDGNETTMDMGRLMKIVLDAGYRSWIGIEYEGNRLSEFEGVAAAKKYLDRALAA